LTLVPRHKASNDSTVVFNDIELVTSNGIGRQGFMDYGQNMPNQEQLNQSKNTINNKKYKERVNKSIDV